MELNKTRNGIEFELSDTGIKNKRGIYRIVFGPKFYIGSANNISVRMAAHKFQINRLLSGGKYTKENIFYRHIISFLLINEDIQVARVDLLQEHVPNSGVFMETLEKKWIRDLNASHACLNCTERQPINLTL